MAEPMADSVAGTNTTDRLTALLLPDRLRTAGIVTGAYLVLFSMFGYVYDWEFVVESDPMFLSMLVVLPPAVWLSLDALANAPIAIERLRDRGALRTHPAHDDGLDPVDAAVVTAERWLVDGLRWLAPVAGAAGMYVALWWEASSRTGKNSPIWVASMAGEFGWPTALVVLGWVPVAAVVVTIAWRMAVMVRIVNRIAHAANLHVLVGHPDGCAGLKPLGDQLIKTLLLGAAPAVFVSVWAVLLAADNLSPTMEDLSGRWLIPFRWALLPVFSFGTYVIAVRPILRIRRLMLERNRLLHARIDDLARRIGEQADIVMTTGDADALETGRERLESLRGLYADLFPLPRWPFDRVGAMRALAALLPPVLSFTGIADGLVKILTAILTSG